MEVIQQTAPLPSLRLSEGEEQWIEDQGKGGMKVPTPPGRQTFPVQSEPILGSLESFQTQPLHISKDIVIALITKEIPRFLGSASGKQ